MASFTSTPKLLSIFGAFIVCLSPYITPSFADSFDKKVDFIWGHENSKMDDTGKQLSLSLNTMSGSAFQSKDAYLFGRIDMQIKLVQGNSAGTVSTYYIASPGGPNHDEVDFEFLGNVSGQPYILHTNLFAHGTGDREQQFYLWFDPTADFHTYTFLWNPRHIAFLVDDIPIRDFKNHKDKGLFFPDSQPMNVYCSIWDGDGWATRGGLVKTDWTQSPFTVHYQNFNPQACVSQKGSLVCYLPEGSDYYTWFGQMLAETDLEKMKWVRENYMVYDYCTDVKRFPKGVPPECLLG
ncbi:Xyloglucan endotransglucosylase/hydrolase [Rhynchospora pubera]|uniref:Xyloglucan endotransglucosylase/hydrolase n=1 Tax=Rhynchospora pubera TaxID=906938 RepID=A0AAV8FFN7_9POAL|nr:Xyloglucan endotransglucosylase/hydrolase [Rhynchospora pubera]